jgi:divinyl chlorophyllide a 8-vinyl-reductase
VWDAGVTHMVLLSAISVHKPLLAFQQAKLAFEQALVESVLCRAGWGVSKGQTLSGVRQRCADNLQAHPRRDLGDYLVGFVADASRHNRVLPN